MHLAQMAHVPPTWIEPEPVPSGSDAGSWHPDPLIGALLYRRGIHDRAAAADFLDSRRRPAPDHSRLPNIERAIARIDEAIAKDQRIGIFGDYDVDGITSTALLTLALRSIVSADRVVPALPERADGYGLKERAIRAMATAGVKLLITVDCGSSDHEQAAIVTASGMDLLILDHHRMADDGPQGAITVSPQLAEDSDLHDLSAVGIVYLLVSALAQAGYRVADGHDDGEAGFLDLVALGTVADVASLRGVNRALVRDGVRALDCSGARPGVQALLRAAGVAPNTVTAEDIAFRIGPRLNAAGRIASPCLAFDLLMASDPVDAQRMAGALEALNQQRKLRTDRLMREATNVIERTPGWKGRSVLALHSPDWPSGLVGAAASRLAEELRRPVLVLREDGEVLHGSARSVNGFNLVDALASVSSLLTRYGGHSMAAGVTLPKAHLPRLEAHLEDALAQTELPIPAPRRIAIDADLGGGPPSTQTVRALAPLEPFGTGNPVPIFRIRDARVQRYTSMGQEKQHLKITVTVGGQPLEALLWSAAWRSSELLAVRTIDLVGRLEINEWNGRERLQMIAEDFRPS
ncbi:MAG: RecJ [uncultured Thermomicrobiales bacterium]|uniref:Single-stranded-DNA-specific exonuclease RecJ n=1 Tax=uncultured Thermomicrobiales bacterium TaxID=1645740 RepID=A0A6J4VBD8_9BACT|nr:MAG: RecJ [uncultured Thermomicrobiales bacterium]